MYDNEPIHTMHMMNVNGNNFRNRGRSQSGIVSVNRKCIGHMTNHITLRKQLFSFGNRINEYPFGIMSTSAISLTSIEPATALDDDTFTVAALVVMSTFEPIICSSEPIMLSCESMPDIFLGGESSADDDTELTVMITEEGGGISLLLSSMCVIFLMLPLC